MGTQPVSAAKTAAAAERLAAKLGIKPTRAAFGSDLYNCWARILLWASVCSEAERPAAVREANRYAVR